MMPPKRLRQSLFCWLPNTRGRAHLSGGPNAEKKKAARMPRADAMNMKTPFTYCARRHFRLPYATLSISVLFLRQGPRDPTVWVIQACLRRRLEELQPIEGSKRVLLLSEHRGFPSHGVSSLTASPTIQREVLGPHEGVVGPDRRPQTCQVSAVSRVSMSLSRAAKAEAVTGWAWTMPFTSGRFR